MPGARLRQMIGGAALAVSVAAPASAEVPRPLLPAAEGESCVEPTAAMRSDHFRFILHQRDETVQRGIRTPRHSLAGCIGCHARRDENGDWLAVHAQGEFCQSCHAYAAVRIDCFDCHSGVPAEGRDGPTMPAAAGSSAGGGQ